MSFADTLLSTGERIIHREKQHWFVFVWGARFTILAIVVAVILLFLSNGLSTRRASPGGLPVRPRLGRRRRSSSRAWSSSAGRRSTTSTRSTSSPTGG